jgi:hypothetical protein
MGKVLRRLRKGTSHQKPNCLYRGHGHGKSGKVQSQSSCHNQQGGIQNWPTCNQCNMTHTQGQCPAKHAKCNSCHLKMGHYVVRCPTKPDSVREATEPVYQADNSSFFLGSVSKDSDQVPAKKPWNIFSNSWGAYKL